MIARITITLLTPVLLGCGEPHLDSCSDRTALQDPVVRSSCLIPLAIEAFPNYALTDALLLSEQTQPDPHILRLTIQLAAAERRLAVIDASRGNYWPVTFSRMMNIKADPDRSIVGAHVVVLVSSKENEIYRKAAAKFGFKLKLVDLTKKSTNGA